MLDVATEIETQSLGDYIIENEYDIVKARQNVRQFAKDIGMGIVDQTRITTAVSELFRNMFNYAGGGEVIVERGNIEGHDSLIITCIDHGPGIEDLEQAMNDGYTSGQGMGFGLPGTKRLVDKFEIESKKNEGTTVRIAKWK